MTTLEDTIQEAAGAGRLHAITIYRDRAGRGWQVSTQAAPGAAYRVEIRPTITEALRACLGVAATEDVFG